LRAFFVEVVNGPEIESQFSGIPFWEKELNEGHRLTAIGGSDNHQADLPANAARAIGSPATMVYAEELSQTAILRAIRHFAVDLRCGDRLFPEIQSAPILKMA
jgi:hypothetical protein